MPVHYKRGEIVYHEGESSRKFYMINQGTVSLSKKSLISEKKEQKEIIGVLEMLNGFGGEINFEI